MTRSARRLSRPAWSRPNSRHDIIDPVKTALPEWRRKSLTLDAIARAIRFALEHTNGVNINEVVVARPRRVCKSRGDTSMCLAVDTSTRGQWARAYGERLPAAAMAVGYLSPMARRYAAPQRQPSGSAFVRTVSLFGPI